MEDLNAPPFLEEAIFCAHAQKDWEKLFSLAQSFIQKYPNHPLGYKAAGVALFEQKEKKVALPFMQRAAELLPDDAESLSNYAQNLLEVGDFKDFQLSESLLRKALIFAPDSPVVLNNLAGALIRQNRLEKARFFAQKAFEKDENNPEIYKNLIVSTVDGRESQKIAEKARDKFPENFDFQSHCFSFAHYFSDQLKDFLPQLNAFQNYVKSHCTPLPFDFSSYKKPKKRLKIGFVSGDFNRHIVAAFLKDFLFHLKALPVDLYAYSNNSTEDEVTQALRVLFRRFTPIYALNDEAAARLIFQERVDILVDLSGHTLHNRLSLFALKPAPVTLTFLGWNGTSGIPTMDYIFLDSILCPNEQFQRQFSETVFPTQHLWASYAYREHFPKILPLPLFKNGYLTFGAFHNPNKVGNLTLSLWAEVLKNNPKTRLLWMRKPSKNPKTRLYFQRIFESLGVDQERVFLEGNDSLMEYLNAHNRVDFLLDTFPVSGASTLVEALLMGKASLTLTGESLASRLGAHYLTHANLPFWVANSKAEYLQKAQFLVTDFLENPNKWNDFAQNLREKIKASPLCDSQKFAQDFLKDCQSIWDIFLNSPR